MNDAPLTDEVVRNAFYSLKTNKSPGNNDISFNAVNNVFDSIVDPLRYFSGRNENCKNNAHIKRWR